VYLDFGEARPIFKFSGGDISVLPL